MTFCHDLVNSLIDRYFEFVGAKIIANNLFYFRDTSNTYYYIFYLGIDRGKNVIYIMVQDRASRKPALRNTAGHPTRLIGRIDIFTEISARNRVLNRPLARISLLLSEIFRTWKHESACTAREQR